MVDILGYLFAHVSVTQSLTLNNASD